MIQLGQRYTKGKKGPVLWTVADYNPSTDIVTLRSDRGAIETRTYDDCADAIKARRLVATL